MSLRGWLQSFNLSESFESLQGLPAHLLAAVDLQHLLQANENLLMLMIWEMTTRSKLGRVLILLARLDSR